MRDRRQIGQAAENAACQILQNHGYRIVTRNVRTRRGEIDVIAWDGGTLVFVEVRSRRHQTVGVVAESVGTRKKQRLIDLAAAYVQSLNEVPDLWRVDVLAIELDATGGVLNFELFRSAVEG
jgi:putative endonuclease